LKSTIRQLVSSIPFIENFEELKSVERRGWKTKAGISEPESVADHSLLLVLLCLIYADAEKVDPVKMTRMALLHDLAEVRIGDATPEEIQDISTRREDEHKLIQDFIKLLPSEVGRYWAEAATELFARTSTEANLVWDLDKLEMVIQAKIYGKKISDPELVKEFFATASRSIQNPDIVYLVEKIRSSE
jgi:putative hydrolase of HD superfamily